MRLLALVAVLGISGCGGSPCKDSIDFANSKKMADVVSWFDAHVFSSAPAEKFRSGRGVINPGDYEFKREFVAGSGVVPGDFRYVSVVGEYSRPTAVFLSKESFLGVLIARSSADDVVRYFQMEGDVVSQVNDRVGPPIPGC